MPCETLESSLLSTRAFAEWSRQVVLVLHNTSHVDGEPYPELLYQTGGIGFPTVSFLDADGRPLEQVGNVVTLEQCETAYKALQDWQALRAAVERGGAGAAREKELFLLELKLGNRPFAEMVQRRDALQLSADDRKATEQPLVNLEFLETLRSTPRDRQWVGGEKFVAMWRAGRIPDPANETPFWQYQFAFASKQKDVALFKELLGWLREHRSGDVRLQRYLKLLEQQLAQLEAGAGR